MMIYVLGFLVVVLLAVVVLMLIQKYTKLEFVTHAKLLFKTWSVWLGSVGTILTAICQAIPDATITMWSALPDDVKSTLPPSAVSFIGPFMMAMGILSQFVKQGKLDTQRKQLEQKQ